MGQPHRRHSPAEAGCWTPVTASCRKAATIWPAQAQQRAAQKRLRAQRCLWSAEAASAAAAPQAALPASIYFDTGKSTLPADAKAAVDAAAAYAKAHPDAKFTLSGFTDATGSAEVNAKLAKSRAEAVRDALKAAGIAEDHIILKKPETITGGSDAKEARRVQISPAA